MRKIAMLTLAMALTLAACGGGDEGSSDTTTTSTDNGQTGTTQPPATDQTTQPAPAATTTTAAPSDEGQSSGADGSEGSVTIAGETYLFADTGFPGLQCMPKAFNVAFIAALRQVDENGSELDGSISVGIPFPGQEETAGIVPELNVSVGDKTWIASPDHAELNSIPAGSSQVDDYEINGDTVSGTATFYDEDSSFGGGDLVVEQGTFELTCAAS